MANCDFREIKQDTYRCQDCGCVVVAKVLPIYATCAAKPPDPPPVQPKPHLGNCRHLGNQVRLSTCESCGGHVQIKVFACAVFGECTAAKLIGNVACCATCQRWEPADINTPAES